MRKTDDILRFILFSCIRCAFFYTGRGGIFTPHMYTGSAKFCIAILRSESLPGNGMCALPAH